MEDFSIVPTPKRFLDYKSSSFLTDYCSLTVALCCRLGEH